MGYSAQQPDLWQQERRLSDAIEGLALLVRAIAWSAGVTLADLEGRVAPPSASLPGSGPDQQWRGAPPVALAVQPAGADIPA